ncbi:hypothetical protein LSUE1_G005731 [Lachnellula suecica]|uniref:Myb-like domain-containing protein n=1 Tax=Lachnellula suecica TaxID=602035 RepID=A0A8T9CA42_9HELO|nr:hypothetical protein LSUE1_G005731 [Lachnellula suecica]
MFINANPRVVSNGYEAFVPVQIAESLHRRLVEMTNNDINAWSVSRPVVPSTSNGWEHPIDDFNTNENFQFPDASSVAGPQTSYLPKSASYTVSRPGRFPLYKNPVPYQVYHEPPLDMSCVQTPSPNPGDPYFQCGPNHGRGSFAEFSNLRRDLKDVYQAPESDLVAMTAASSVPQTLPSYIRSNTTTHDYMDIKPPQDVIYSDFQQHTTNIDQQSLISQEVPAAIDNATKMKWWSEVSRNSSAQSGHGLSATNDRLANYQPEQQDFEYGNIWNNELPSTKTWATQAAVAESTISPKLLTLDVPSAPLSSSGSIQETIISYSDSSSNHSVAEDADLSGPDQLIVIEQPVLIPPPRQMPPESMPSPRRAASSILSNKTPSPKAPKKRLLKSKSAGNSRRRRGISKDSEAEYHPKRSGPTGPKASAQKRLEPNNRQADEESWTGSPSPQTSTNAQAAHHRDAKDDFLVRSKLAGMSYKAIREQGKFTEAESTLRGRFRTLTKHKTARVRKPEWTDSDIKLLKKAVRKLTRSSDHAASRVPWKLVAEYIANHGGSYHFGNATCRKRWDELRGQ